MERPSLTSLFPSAISKKLTNQFNNSDHQLLPTISTFATHPWDCL